MPLPSFVDDDHRSPADRAAEGRGRREHVPLEALADVPLPPGRDPVAILERQASDRLPDLVPIRYGRMGASAFAFYRGGAAIMAADLAAAPDTGLRAQLCGDAHLLNFGLFETPERTLVFGLNDFDETLPGPFEWDVKRLAASIEVAGRDLGHPRAKRRKATVAAARAYRRAMAQFATMRTIDVWYARLPADDLRRQLDAQGDPTSVQEVDREVAKALRKDHLRAVDRLVEAHGDGLRFRSEPPILVPVEQVLEEEQQPNLEPVLRELQRQYLASLPSDRRRLVSTYRTVHLARKVVGVGSVGTRAWVLLLTGRDDADPLVLQLKEAQESVLAPYAGASECESQGQRVVEGQRLMQAASDHLLGWYSVTTFDGTHHDFYVRQLWDGKASIDVTHLTPRGLRAYAGACGWTLARGHARSGDRIALAAYLGEGPEFEEAIAEFAKAYADRNADDHRALVEAIATRHIASIEA